MAKGKMTPFILAVCKLCEFRYNCPIHKISREFIIDCNKMYSSISKKLGITNSPVYEPISTDHYLESEIHRIGIQGKCKCRTILGTRIDYERYFKQPFLEDRLWPEE